MADFNLNFIETDVLVEANGLDMVIDTVYHSNDGRVFVSGMDFNNGDKPFAMELQLPEGTELQAGGGSQINKANKALLTEDILAQAVSEHKANIQHLKDGVDPHIYCEDTYKSSPGLKANTPDATPQVDTKYAGYDDYLQRYQGDDVLPYILTENGQNLGQDTIDKLSQDHPQFKQDMDMHMQNGMSARDAAQHALVNIHPDLDSNMKAQFFDDAARLQTAETLARIADKNPGFHDHFDSLMKQNGGFAETAAKGALVNLYPNLYTDLVPGENGLSQNVPDQDRMTSIALNTDGRSLEDLERHVDGRLEDTRNPLQKNQLTPDTPSNMLDSSMAYKGEVVDIDKRTGGVSGIKNALIKGAAATAAVTALSGAAAAAELPQDVEAAYLAGDVDGATQILIDSGEYSGTVHRLTISGADPHEVIKGFILDNQGLEAEASQAYAAGLGTDPDIIQDVLEGNWTATAGNYVELAVGEDAKNHFDQTLNLGLTATFSLADGNWDKFLDHSLQGLGHLGSGIKETGMHIMGGEEIMNAWNSGDDFWDSAAKSAYTTADIGGAILSSGLEMGVGLVKGTLIAAGIDPRYPLEKSEIHEAVALMSEKGVPENASPELLALVENYKIDGAQTIAALSDNKMNATIPMTQYGNLVVAMADEGSFDEVIQHLNEPSLKQHLASLENTEANPEQKLASVNPEYTTTMTL